MPKKKKKEKRKIKTKNKTKKQNKKDERNYFPNFCSIHSFLNAHAFTKLINFVQKNKKKNDPFIFPFKKRKHF